VHITAVSLYAAVQATFFRISLQIIWHPVFYMEIWLGCTRHSSVIDTAVTCTMVSLTPLWHLQRCQWHVQWCHWHHCNLHSHVNDTAVTCTAVSITLLCKYDARCDFGPHIREALATFKGNIYQKNIHRQIVLHYTTHPILTHKKIWGLTRERFLSQRCK
jgi:hypothetical protein